MKKKNELEQSIDKLAKITKRPMKYHRQGFFITNNHGFHITFANGYTVSVQFGPGNYCDNYSRNWDEAEQCGKDGSFTAECAVWPQEGHMLAYSDWGNTVSSHSTPAEVLELLNWAASQKKEHDDD